MQPARNIVQLRQLLAERLPHLRQLPLPGVRKELAARTPPGAPGLGHWIAQGFPKSAITEVVGKPGGGGALFIQGLLRRAAVTGQWLALIDGLNSFDPTALEQEVLDRLLWVRCDDATQAIKAADLLLRDDNLPLVVLDLTLNAPAQLRKIPATVWYRFQRLIEHHTTALAVFTPQALVGGAPNRLLLSHRLDLDALQQAQADLLAQLRVEVTRWDGREIGAHAEPVAQTG